jgi:hypothetical protein
MFIALVIGAILLLQGIALFFLLREALLSNVEDTARDRASSAARSIQSGEDLSGEDIEQFALDGVFVVIRDRKGKALNQTVNLPTDTLDQDPVWRKALSSNEAVSGTAELPGRLPITSMQCRSTHRAVPCGWWRPGNPSSPLRRP